MLHEFRRYRYQFHLCANCSEETICPLKRDFIIEVNQARVFGGGRRGADGPGGPRRGDSMDKGDNYRERSPLDDRGRDRDRYRYSLMQYSMQTLQWQEGWQ